MPATMLSIDTDLRSTLDAVDDATLKAGGYTPLKQGSPLVISYLYVVAKLDVDDSGQKIMLSTFFKQTEEKNGAAEAINYYDPDTNFKNGFFRLTDFGAELYGHPLIYYTGSFLGESLRLTVKLMDLHKLDDAIIKAIDGGIDKVAGLPAFSAYLPYMGAAKAGLNIFEQIVNFFEKDQPIIKNHDVDLHFNPSAGGLRRLQPGRYVCVPDKDESDLKGVYQMESPNQGDRLIRKDNQQEYSDGPYFVFQINNEPHAAYDKFDYYQGAAQLLEQTNRDTDPQTLINSMASAFQAQQDLGYAQQIDQLSLSPSPDVAKMQSIYALMSPQMQGLYQQKIKDAAGSHKALFALGKVGLVSMQ